MSRRSKFIIGLLLLFCFYHFTEIIQRKYPAAPTAFLELSMSVFIFIAYWLGKKQNLNGLAGWGLDRLPRKWPQIIIGLLIGAIFSGLAFVIAVFINVIHITAVPSLLNCLRILLLVALGTILPSLAEDILTRGYLYAHLKNSIRPYSFVLISALFFTFNHLSRWNDGLGILLFLFFGGIALALPLIYSKSLWVTFGMHWGLNIIYQLTNNIIGTETTDASIANWILTGCIFLMVLFNFFVFQKIFPANIKIRVSS